MFMPDQAIPATARHAEVGGAARMQDTSPRATALRVRSGVAHRFRDAIVRLLLGCITLVSLPAPAHAYPGEVHQQLSFLAARVFNRCVENTAIPKLSTLNVRYAARSASEEASAGFVSRTLRWQYYDRRQSQDPGAWLGVVETTMQARFLDLERVLPVGRDARVVDQVGDLEQRYTDLGRLMSHIQDVTVPAVVVPIYYERFWRLSVSDRFTDYPFTLDDRDRSLDELCAPLLATPEHWSWSNLLNVTAEHTLRAIRGGMPDMDATWQVFWREPDEGGAFGEYGSVGNRFGDEVEFRCGRGAARTRCHLLQNDPVYREFAEARHRDALLATMRAYLLLQRPPPRRSTK